MPREVSTKAEFDSVLKGTDKLVVVDFYADWCGPCKMIAPKLEAIANEMEDQIVVIKVNVDENDETAGACGVSAMPTFHFYKKGEKFSRKSLKCSAPPDTFCWSLYNLQKVGELVGANEAKLKELITIHA